MFSLHLGILLTHLASVIYATTDKSNDNSAYDVFGTGRKVWTLVFRGTRGVGQSVSNVYLEYQSDAVEDGCRQFSPSTPCHNHYRNNKKLDNWRNVDEVAFVLYKDGRRVAHILFDGQGSDSLSWFNKSRVISSSFGEIGKVFSFRFQRGHFSFIITGYNFCTDNIGWVGVIDISGTWCLWKKQLGGDWPRIYYIDGDSVAEADAFGVFVKPCSDGFNIVGERCLKLVTKARTYAAAKENCQKLGARLATPSSEKLFEQLIKWDKMASKNRRKVWIGLTKSPYFFWEDGTRFNETLEYFQKNKIRGIRKTGNSRNCVFAKVKSPRLKAVWCGRKHASVCEKPMTEVEWTDWSNYGPCSAACGQGLKTRTRTCPLAGWCPGHDTESQECIIERCQPPNVKWASWGDYGPCSVTCGRGHMTRKRVCYRNMASQKCPGTNTERKECNTDVLCPYEVPWSEWSTCSVTCGGGRMTRTRRCPQGVWPTRCPKPDIEGKVCNAEDCPPPAWRNWSSWGRCSKDDGRCQKTRTRTCSVHGGCQGQSTESVKCNRKVCWKECRTTGEEIQVGLTYCN